MSEENATGADSNANPPTGERAQTQTNNNHQRRNNNRNNNNNNNSNQRSTSVHQKDWCGGTPELKAVLALKNEKLTYRTSLEVFMEKLNTHCKKELRHYDDVSLLLISHIDPTNKLKKAMPELKTDEEKEKFSKDPLYEFQMKKEVENWQKRCEVLKDNLHKIFGLIYDQCTDAVKAEIKVQRDDWQRKIQVSDCVWLLKVLKTVVSGIDEQSDPFDVLIQSLRDYLFVKQGEDENEDAFFKRLKTLEDSLVLCGGGYLLCPPDLCGTNSNGDVTNKTKESCRERFRAMVMMRGSNGKRYGNLLTEIRNGRDLGNDWWPKTSIDAYQLLSRRNDKQRTNNRNPNGGGRGNPGGGRGHPGGRGRGGLHTDTQFLQDGESREIVQGLNGARLLPTVKCNTCQQYGHLARDCPRGGSSEGGH